MDAGVGFSGAVCAPPPAGGDFAVGVAVSAVGNEDKSTPVSAEAAALATAGAVAVVVAVAVAEAVAVAVTAAVF